jgi:hypothetical protein
MAIAIALLILGLYAFWAFTRKGSAASGPGQIGKPKSKRKSCKWQKTGETKGRFTEYRCKTCGVVALSHTGHAPQDCKSDLGGTRIN